MSKPKHDLYQSLLIAATDQSAKGLDLFAEIEEELNRRLFDYEMMDDLITPIINSDFPINYNLQELGKIYREGEENE
jgi:hypothetical protein